MNFKKADYNPAFRQKLCRFVNIPLQMKMRCLLGMGLLFIMAACTKKNSSSISLKIASVSGGIVPVGGGLQVLFSFTDDGATIDTLGMLKRRINQNQVATVRDTIFYGVPAYPSTTKGQLQLDLDHDIDLVSAINPPTTTDPSQYESDSLILRFFAKDTHGHTSDTVNSGTIIVLR
jgi:hypothetical protein